MKKFIFKLFCKKKTSAPNETIVKYLIAGLGNIGSEYTHTRHNIGFEVLNALTSLNEVSFEPGRYADTALIKFKGRILILIKPTTFVNLSGKAINYWMQKENIPIENILILCDDLALPFGVLRLKGKGGDGGHNGLINIIETLGKSDFARLRFGLSDHFSKGKQVEYVLGKWSQEEEKALPARILTACDIIKSFTTLGLEKTMTAYNKK